MSTLGSIVTGLVNGGASGAEASASGESYTAASVDSGLVALGVGFGGFLGGSFGGAVGGFSEVLQVLWLLNGLTTNPSVLRRRLPTGSSQVLPVQLLEFSEALLSSS